MRWLVHTKASGHGASAGVLPSERLIVERLELRFQGAPLAPELAERLATQAVELVVNPASAAVESEPRAVAIAEAIRAALSAETFEG
jgi:hypothetical protein